jgi:hypothetical protein
VYAQRHLPSTITPAIIVYTSGDTSEKTPDEGTNKRLEDLTIVVHDTGKENWELGSGEISIADTLDNYAATIEGRFNKRRETLGNKIYRMNYVSTNISYKIDTDTLIGIIILKYTVAWNENLS